MSYFRLRHALKMCCALVLVYSQFAFAVPVVYYDLDFEDGGYGGGDTFSVFQLPENIADSNLDGRALEFEPQYSPNFQEQIRWTRNGPESIYHYVGFDYFAGSDANLTFFFDLPSILRFDLTETGRHHVDLYFNLDDQTVYSYLDGVLFGDMLSIAAWPISPVSNTIRFVNQTQAPGNSEGRFEVDNVVWKGDNVSMRAVEVPEPVSLGLLAVGLILLYQLRGQRPAVVR